ncbi:serine/threonine-protein phosphatase [Streptomyces kunmingensis]|uniref:Serine/threonine-protein phosphatase n=1 Tax=Streptomyces kunmingensis TaxID=68225 RepID=A0ABU6C7J7_9ACTN|nr:PP2C family protein-serine/threonine phosphatase [Streptomyces kunmingensis]MEB3960669.1 serine/threonine-protein phosphatase [Streptomyces kunmingensis]
MSSPAVEAAAAVGPRDPYATVTADEAGRVLFCNDRAGALLEGLRAGVLLMDTAPAWLAEAHAEVLRGTDPNPPVARGRVKDRTVDAFPSRGTDGAVSWWLVDDGDLRSAHDQLESERTRSRVLQEISSELLASLNADRCMEVTARMAAQHLADAAVIVGVRSGRTYPVTRCTTGGPVVQEKIALEPGELPGLSEALLGFPPVPSRWIDPAQVPEWAIPAEFAAEGGRIGSVVVVPLPGHGLPAGAIVMMRHNQEAAFTDAEEAFARLFAARAGAALSAARIYAEQTHITDVLMRELLPPVLQGVRGVDFSGRYRAAAAGERVGGDFYDVYPADSDEDETFAVLGDVCGKGLEAAVLTGKIRNTIEALLPFAADHHRVLTLLNNALLTSHHTRFATLALASVKREGSRVRLRVSSAGHPTPLIVRSDGQVEEADTMGMLIGALPTDMLKVTTATVDLAPGETCLLYSDGITEAHGGPLGDAMFGEQRLRNTLAQCAGLPAEAVTEYVQMIASQWIQGGAHDDIALLAITAPRNNHLTAVDGHTRGRFTA